MYSEDRSKTKLASKFPKYLMPTVEMQQAVYIILKQITSDKNVVVSYKFVLNNSFFEINLDKNTKIVSYRGQKAYILAEYMNGIFKVYENILLYITEKQEIFMDRMNKVTKIS